MDKEPKWRRFEKVVAKIQQTLAPAATVRHNEYIVGRSGNRRQVDVTVRQTIGQFNLLIAIQCKDTKRPVGLQDLALFSELSRDIQASQAAIVSSSGFRSSVKREAERVGIELYRLVDAESQDWKVAIRAPIMYRMRELKGYSSSLSFPQLAPAIIPDPRTFRYCNASGEDLGMMESLIKASWSRGELPTSPGVHQNLALGDSPLFIKQDEQLYAVEARVTIHVSERLFVGYSPIERMRGFQNVQSGGVVTTGLTTGWISTEDIYSSRRIDSEQELAVTPILEIEAVSS